jgi:hypothetical protein
VRSRRAWRLAAACVPPCAYLTQPVCCWLVRHLRYLHHSGTTAAGGGKHSSYLPPFYLPACAIRTSACLPPPLRHAPAASPWRGDAYCIKTDLLEEERTAAGTACVRLAPSCQHRYYTAALCCQHFLAAWLPAMPLLAALALPRFFCLLPPGCYAASFLAIPHLSLPLRPSPLSLSPRRILLYRRASCARTDAIQAAIHTILTSLADSGQDG